jgi:hypothetical protein
VSVDNHAVSGLNSCFIMCFTRTGDAGDELTSGDAYTLEADETLEVHRSKRTKSSFAPGTAAWDVRASVVAEIAAEVERRRTTNEMPRRLSAVVPVRPFYNSSEAAISSQQLNLELSRSPNSHSPEGSCSEGVEAPCSPTNEDEADSEAMVCSRLPFEQPETWRWDDALTMLNRHIHNALELYEL